MRFFLFISALILLSGITACKKEFEGDKTNFGPPETFLVVDSIYRSGDTRYTTTVEAHWWGITKTGYIEGYKVSIDNVNWTYTKSQDSLFLLSLPGGADTADIRIYVKAVNNLGVEDPTPASIAYPVKNTAPTITFDYSFGRKSKAFPAFRYNWVASDIDGTQDINAIEVALNDTSLNVIQIGPTVTAASFVGDKTAGVFNGEFSVYTNAQTTPFTQKLKGAKYDDLNFVYIRSIDRTGAKSAWVKDSIYLKSPRNGILFINDYNIKPSINAFYSNRINNLGTAYSNFDTVNSILDEFPSDEFTTRKTFEFFNRIVWATQEPVRSLGIAQKGTETFFNNGGRIFMVLEIPNDVSPDNDVFSFTPIQRLIVDPGKAFRMTDTCKVYGYNNSWPVLKATTIITFPKPYTTYSQSTGLFVYDSLAKASLFSFSSAGLTPWTGPSNVMSKRVKTQTGKADFITLTVPLSQMNGNNNVDSFFRKVVIDGLQF